ncbi:MAG: hypothetical protein FWD26_01640 [Treponema sp.]|nr:hypothetical protein [Treponema sp.]
MNKIRIAVFAAAITQLALSQFAIRMTRLSAEELTGISYFAFIIFGLVTVFSVSGIKESFGSKIFAVIMNFVTSFSAVLYLIMLFGDEIFFRNIYYTLNRQTQVYELLPLSARIITSIPLALVILGAAVYCFCAFAVLVFGFRKKNENSA